MKKTQIMYIQDNSGFTEGPRIGRVSFSKTGKTLYYGECEFHSLGGYGWKANFYDENSRCPDAGTVSHYWISGCKKDGQDTLYPDTVLIDEDAREEYWLNIRNLPDQVKDSSFRSEGKHAGWRRKDFKR